MLYLAWDREINILLFFCDVFVWKWGPRPRTSSRCYHGNKTAATFKKGIFVHPPWVPNCMQNLKGGWKFSFPKMFDSHRLVHNMASIYTIISLPISQFIPLNPISQLHLYLLISSKQVPLFKQGLLTQSSISTKSIFRQISSCLWIITLYGYKERFFK